jgi:valyl-tRNA synthetase
MTGVIRDAALDALAVLLPVGCAGCGAPDRGLCAECRAALSPAVRYWAASSRLGTDAAFDPQNPKQIKIGRRLAIKVLNAAKFVYSFEVPGGSLRDGGSAVPLPEEAAGRLEGSTAITHPLDRDLLAELGEVIRIATRAYDEYDHARALEVAEQFFWTFCDDYLELVKERAYGAAGAEGQASAVVTLRTAVDVLLRLFAPVLPFATEEVWSWTHDGSIHTAPWPTTQEATPSEPAVSTGLLGLVSEALIGIRRAKTDAKASQKTEVASATIAGPALLREAADDLRAVGRIADLEFTESDEVAVTSIVLAESVD